MTFSLVLLLASSLLVIVDSVSKRQTPRCGTAAVDLSPLMSVYDYLLPAGVPCSLPQCSMGKLPWSVFFNICQPVQTSGPLVANCVGAQACQLWPGDSASWGQFSTVSYSDTVGGVILTATGGSQVDGVSRQMMLTILCAAQSDPYPTFTSEDSSSLTMSFSWNRTEACPQHIPQPTPVCNGKSCLAAIDFCTAAVGPSDACRCFSKAADCFQNCTSSDVSLLKAEVACFKLGCGQSDCMF
jgi:hypothetical protein